MLAISRWILRVLNWLNWGVGIPAFLVLLVAALVVPTQFTAALGRSMTPADAAVLLVWLRWALVIILPVIPLTHIILVHLIAIIDSVPAGTALSVGNAERLQKIAWALMGINILDLIFGLVTVWAENLTDQPLGWSLTLTGWLAALMLFILARVFRDGATMRDDLAGTV